MAEGHSERERRRMAQRYAGMSDEELRELAGDAQSLTHDAQAALRAELSRRGLEIPVADMRLARPPSGPVVLRRYLWLHEALVAQSLLDSAGIDGVLGD